LGLEFLYWNVLFKVLGLFVNNGLVLSEILREIDSFGKRFLGDLWIMKDFEVFLWF
jgi:hypothetical protein